MALTRAEKTVYNEHIKGFKSEIDDSYKNIKEIEVKKKKMKNIAGYLNFEIILEYLKIIKNYVHMSDASLEMLQMKNERFLDNARKDIFKVIQVLEELVGKDIDRSLKENEDYLKKVDKINPLQILRIIQNINNSFMIVVEKMGEGSKWKWSFVDMQGRIAVATKNSINFSDIQKYRDPRTDFYKERQEMLKICKLSLSDAAKQYRNKYEISTKVPEDILRSIEMLSALRKIHILFGESEDANKLKNTIDALRARLESDEKKDEKKKKK